MVVQERERPVVGISNGVVVSYFSVVVMIFWFFLRALVLNGFVSIDWVGKVCSLCPSRCASKTHRSSAVFADLFGGVVFH